MAPERSGLNPLATLLAPRMPYCCAAGYGVHLTVFCALLDVRLRMLGGGGSEASKGSCATVPRQVKRTKIRVCISGRGSFFIRETCKLFPEFELVYRRYLNTRCADRNRGYKKDFARACGICQTALFLFWSLRQAAIGILTWAGGPLRVLGRHFSCKRN